MFYVVNNHLNNLYVLSNKAVGPGKNPKLINVGRTFIPESSVLNIGPTYVFWIPPVLFWLDLENGKNIYY